MIIYKKNELVTGHPFDKHNEMEQYFDCLQDEPKVVHCHHYTVLYTQLAFDAKETELLAETTEDTFYNLFNNYYHQCHIEDKILRMELACQYYAKMGMGSMDIICLAEEGGEVKLLSSHVDSGWLTKWGQYDVPVNYIGVGYIAAMFAAVLGYPLRYFQVIEVQSIVMGASCSLFRVARR
jgi:hypothetical protein